MMMYLYDWLKQVSVKDAVIALREQFGCTDNMDFETQFAMYAYFQDALLELSPIYHDDRILLGHTVQDIWDSTLASLCVSVYDVDEMKRFSSPLKAVADGAPRATLYGPPFPSDDTVYFRGGYAFDFVNWADVLGFLVDEQNIGACGADRFAACVLDELSFNGITEEEQHERLSQLDQAVADYEAVRVMPEEERAKHLAKVELDLSCAPIVSDERFEEVCAYNAKSMAQTLCAFLDKQESVR